MKVTVHEPEALHVTVREPEALHITVREPEILRVTVHEGPPGRPGPPGPPGPPGKNGDDSGALLIDNRLNEFAGDTAAQVQAQANLGLGVADPLAYYILAKS